MSILVVEVLPQGIILGADRNVTRTAIREDADGKVIQASFGQMQRRKVLRWPNRKALVGYVGAATIARIPTDEWLYDFIGDNLTFSSFEDLAHDLTERIQKQRGLDEGESAPVPLVLHLAGFEERDAHQVPMVWYIRNAYDLKDGYYTDIRKEFLCTEEFWAYFPQIPPERIRERLDELAKGFQPFWFHQGLDLGTFNALDGFLKGAFKLLCERHPEHSFPLTLREWEQHLKMLILTYGAYYQAFRGPGEQYVGGGSNTVSLSWPLI